MSKKHPECPLYNHNNCKQVYSSKICAISQSGLFIETNKPLFVGERVIMSFNMNGYDRPFKIRGEIVHANRLGVGVEYRETSPYITDMIDTLVGRINN